MKRKNKNKSDHDKFGEITLLILEGIAKFGEITILSFVNQKALRKNLYSDGFEAERFFDHIRSLKKRGYIEVDENNRNSIRLSNKGRIKLIENSGDRTIDGKWRIISFDIPEKYRSKRDCFRRSIKHIGFKKVQKSLWVCPYIKADEIEIIIKEFDLNKYVAYFIVEKTDIENYLKKLFSTEI